MSHDGAGSSTSHPWDAAKPTAGVHTVDNTSDTARIRQNSSGVSLARSASESEPPQRNAITMLPNFNEGVRPRHSLVADELHSDNQNTENHDDRIGNKRKAKSPPRISPPPLKRHDRTSSTGQSSGSQTPLEHSTSGQRSGKKAAISQDNLQDLPVLLSRATASPLPTDLQSIDCNADATGRHFVSSTISKVGRQQFHHQHEPSSSSLNIGHTACSTVGREEDEISISSSNIRPGTPAGVTPKCFYCRKSLSTSYDSLSKCSTCSKHSHDGCRKPQLAKGQDRTTWRCYQCLWKDRTSTNETSTSWKSSPRSTPAVNDKFPNQTLPECRRHSKKPAQASFVPTVPSKAGTQVQPIHNSGPRQGRASPRSSAYRSPAQRTEAKTPGNDDTIFDRPEIQDTPNQRSSQLSVESTGALATNTYDSTVSQSLQTESPVVIDEPTSKSFLPSTRLCMWCQTRRVFGQNGVKDPMCHECKRTISNVNNDSSMITVPETPESATATHQDEGIVEGVSEPASAISATSEAAHGGFWSNSILTTKRIKQRRIQGMFPSLGDRNLIQRPTTAEISEQSHLAPPADCNTNEHTTELVEDPTVEPNRETRSSVDNPLDNPATYLANREDRTAKTLTTEREPRSSPLYVSVNGKETSNVSGKALQRTNTELSPKTVPKSVIMQPQYSTRELIGMALIAAKSTPLTWREIGEWVQSTFPKTHQISRGTWYNNISAVLSKHNHFRKIETPGDRLKKWTFINANARKAYMSKFKSLAIEPTSPVDPPPSPSLVVKSKASPKNTGSSKVSVAPCEENQLSIMETRKSSEEPNAEEPDIITADFDKSGLLDQVAERLKGLLVDDISSGGTIQKEKLDQVMRSFSEEWELLRRKNNQAQHTGLEEHEVDGPDAIFMPFEPKQPIAKVVRSDARVETNFFKAFPEFLKPSIENMTEDERNSKIAEIKKRPSRKATFGSLLASARSFRNDIHNELEGYRPPNRPVFSEDALPTRSKRSTNVDRDVEMSEKVVASQSFKVISELPDESIPMLHEGQLAFRDGTPVNGRLPRPRVVYKVGKK